MLDNDSHSIAVPLADNAALCHLAAREPPRGGLGGLAGAALASEREGIRRHHAHALNGVRGVEGAPCERGPIGSKTNVELLAISNEPRATQVRRFPTLTRGVLTSTPGAERARTCRGRAHAMKGGRDPLREAARAVTGDHGPYYISFHLYH